MFTGLVQHLGVVRSIDPSAAGSRLVIDAGAWGHRPEPGESIAVSGCCLTVSAEPEGGLLHFDVVPETLRRTTLGERRVEDPVNLEAAVTPATLLGGHIVQGHVDGVARVERVGGDVEHRVRIAPPAALIACIVEKGSVAVDGVSLTVAAVDETAFEVALIPTTLRLTTLGRLREGDRVNLETDYLVKAVARLMGRQLF